MQVGWRNETRNLWKYYQLGHHPASWLSVGVGGERDAAEEDVLKSNFETWSGKH